MPSSARAGVIEDGESVALVADDGAIGCWAAGSQRGGLLAEVDPGIGAFLGNRPQRLSHLALFNAAALLNEQQG